MSDIFALSHELPKPSPKPPEVFLRVDPSPSPEGLPTKLILRDGKVAANELCCCNCGCLPYTVTAVFDSLVDKTHSQHCKIEITSSVGGSAWGVGMMPGGDDPDDRGPLTSVLLIDGGSGYATMGREPPTLVNIKGSGEDAIFTPVLVINPDLGQGPTCPVWSIESISVSGGTGYTDGEFLKITAAKHDTVFDFPAAIAQLKTKVQRVQPNVTASVDGGQDAQLSVSLQQDNNNPPNWYVTNVNVQNGGSGYFQQYPGIGETLPVSFSANGGTTVSNADVRAYPAVKMPENLITETTGSGVDAEFELTFEPIMIEYWDNGIREALCWQFATVNILNGGSNYSIGDYIGRVVPGDLTTGENQGWFYITNVDENGAILTMDLQYAGRFRESINGSIAGTYVRGGGAYYLDVGNGQPLEVNVISGGGFYHIDPDTPSCVADITVTPCGGGQDAEIIAIVDEDARSPTFGQIIDLEIENGGDGYLVWKWTDTVHSELNGKEFVLRANIPKRLVELEIKSCFGGGAEAVIDNRGPKIEPVITIDSPCAGPWPGAPDISVTLEKNSSDVECQPYWSITSVDIAGHNGALCPTETKAIILKDCWSVAQKEADIDLLRSYDTDGLHLTDFVINDGGKYYKSFEWDGQPAPIYSVSLTHRGSGYAEFGRIEPDMLLKVPDGYGSGATFDFDLIHKLDKCDLPYWTVRNITVSGGQNYQDGKYLIAIEENPDPNDNIFFVEKIPLLAIVRTRTKPNITATVVSEEGYGADIEVHLSEIKANPQSGIYSPRAWMISSISGGGGQDYSEDAHIVLDYGDAVETFQAEFDITIQRGKITCVRVVKNGVYYVDDGIPKEVKLYDGGKYYSNDKDAEPYVTNVDIIIKQKEGSNGYGAIIEAVVEDDTDSLDFGKIVELIIKDCGENYSYFGGSLDCKYIGGCEGSCTQYNPRITVTMPNEKNKPMTAQLLDSSCDAMIDINFKSEDIEDCFQPFPATGLLWWGAPAGNIVVDAGGIWDSTGTDDCPRPSCPPTTTTTVTTITPLSMVSIPSTLDIESDIKMNQKVSFSSNIKCGNDYLHGDGTLDNLSINGIWIKDNVLYHTNVFIDIKCEKFIYNHDEYEYKYQIIVWLVNPDNSNSLLDISEWSPNKSEYTTRIIKTDDGSLKGSVKIYDNNGYYLIVNLE